MSAFMDRKKVAWLGLELGLACMDRKKVPLAVPNGYGCYGCTNYALHHQVPLAPNVLNSQVGPIHATHTSP